MNLRDTFRAWLQGKSGDAATLLAEFRQCLEAQGADLAAVDDAELQAVLGEQQGGGEGAEEYGRPGAHEMVARLNRIAGEERYVVEDGFIGMKDAEGNVHVGNEPRWSAEEIADEGDEAEKPDADAKSG